jgi:cell division protein FtsQ
MAKKKLLNPKVDKILTQVLWVVGGVVLLVAIISAVSQKRASVANQIVVNIKPLPDNSKMITEVDILTTLTRSMGRSPEGIPIVELDLDRIENKILKRDPFISDAEVFIDAKSRLNIDIEQREPFLRIIDASGRNYYLDQDGKYMPTSVNFTARVTVATGYIPSYTPEYRQKKNGTLKHLFRFVEKIHKDEFMKALTEQVFVTKNREFIVVPKVGKQKILFGKNRNIEGKFKQLKIFYKEGMPYEGWQKYSTINLKYEGQVVCKRK